MFLLVFELCSCDFSMRLERRDHNHLAEAVTQCEVEQLVWRMQAKKLRTPQLKK